MARTMEGFVCQEAAPLQARLESHEHGLLRNLVQQAGRLGLLAGGLPDPYGLGLPKATLALLAEKSGIDLCFALTIGVHSGVGAYPLLFFGTAEQIARYLPRIASGELAAAFALTEANAGSDALALETCAVPAGDGKGYVLNGVKAWITNAAIADIFTVFAQVEGAGPTAFLVEGGAPGLSIGPEENKMGLRGSSTCRVAFTETPAEMLGDPGRGHLAALYALNLGRFQIGAIALGAAKEALRIAVEYSGQRRQYGRPIAEFGLVQQKFAEMAARIFAAESMTYRVAGLWDEMLAGSEDQVAALAAISEEYAIECALIKVFATEALGLAADEAMQIHGGYGFSEDYPVARLYRGARVFRIFEGTNEINRLAVMQQIRRRIERGRLSLDLTAGVPDPMAWPLPDDPLAYAGGGVAHIRRLLLAVLPKAFAIDDQQISAAVADLSGLLFALESAWLRCRQMPTEPASQSLLLILADSACRNAGELARSCLAHTSTEIGATLTLIRPIHERPPIDSIDLQRKTARLLAALHP